MDLALYFHNSDPIICQMQIHYWPMGMETIPLTVIIYSASPFDIVALIAAPLLKMIQS
jgi:hypothetical protein